LRPLRENFIFQSTQFKQRGAFFILPNPLPLPI